jgi:hypothetical protein
MMEVELVQMGTNSEEWIEMMGWNGCGIVIGMRS